MRYATIIAGGSGTRLWPMSRADLPKQLIPLFSGRSLLEIAVDRLQGFIPPERQILCTGEKYRRQIRRVLPEFADERILGEPEGRDTLAAVGLPAAVAMREDADAIIGVFTADHLIEPVEQFQRRVEVGYELAEKHPNTLVTFGIEPAYAATGFGYVELGRPLEGFDQAYRAVRFVEKPDARTAEQYVASGRYAWNSGMFVWRAATLLDCIERYKPEVHAGLMQIAAAWATPMMRASQTDRSEISLPHLPRRSLTVSRAAVTSRKTPTHSGKVKSCSTKSSKNRPATTAGNVPMMSSQARRDAGVAGRRANTVVAQSRTRIHRSRKK